MIDLPHLILHRVREPPLPSHILVKHPKFWYNLGFPNPLMGNQVKHLLILISLLLLSSPVIGNNHKGETLYRWDNPSGDGYVWKGFGDKETHPKSVSYTHLTLPTTPYV